MGIDDSNGSGNLLGELLNFLRHNYTLIIILLLFFAVRVPALNQEIYGDEAHNYFFSYAGVDKSAEFGIAPDMFYTYFIPIIFYRLAYTIYGAVISLRLISLIFGLLIMLIGMKTLKSFFSKRAAVIFGILYALMPWTVFSSVLLDNYGTIISLMFVLLLYFTLKLINSGDIHSSRKVSSNSVQISILIIGIITGILVFLQFTLFFSLIFFNIIVLYFYMMREKGLKPWGVRKILSLKALKKSSFMIFMYVSGLLASISLLVAIYYIFLGNSAINYIFLHYLRLTGDQTFSFGGFSTEFFIQLLSVIIFIGPLIYFFMMEILQAIFHQNVYSKENHSQLYVIGLTLFYMLELAVLLYSYNQASLDRYAIFLVAPLLILVSVYLSRFLMHTKKSNDWKKIIGFLISSIIISIIYFFVDFLPHRILDFYPKSNWFDAIMHSKWNFLFPINGAIGPIGYYVSFLNIAIPFLISGVLSIILIISIWYKYLWRKYKGNKKKSIYRCGSYKNGIYRNRIIRKILAVIIILSLSYAIYLDIQFAYGITTPSINTINKELRMDCNFNESYVFRNQGGFATENRMTIIGVKTINFEELNNRTFVGNVISSVENICIVDFPQISKDSIFWRDVSVNCTLIKKYEDKGFTLGYWFKC